MIVEFDPAKDEENRLSHGISLARAAEIEILLTEPDRRFPYNEDRWRAWGLIEGEAWCLAYTLRSGRLRAISLRRAGEKEMRRIWTRRSSGGA